MTISYKLILIGILLVDESVETKHEMAKLEGARSDSPGPIVGGDAAPNIMVQEMPIPDDISLPSIQNYDISSDESLQNVRVAIRTTERWDDDLERKWRTWKDEEAKSVSLIYIWHIFLTQVIAYFLSLILTFYFL